MAGSGPVATRHQRASLIYEYLALSANGKRMNTKNLGARAPEKSAADKTDEKLLLFAPTQLTPKDKRAGTTSNLHLGTIRQKR